MPVYPKAAPPSRVVRGEELRDLFRAVKGALYDLVSSSCTSGRMARRGRWEPVRPPQRNHSSSLEESGCSGGFHKSPTCSAARESIFGSGSDNATTPEGGNAEREREPSDAAIDIRSSGGAPKETGGVPRSAKVPARSIPAGCGVLGEELQIVHVWHCGVYYATPRWSCLHKKNMNHSRKLPQRAECPGTWGSNCDHPDHIQKCMGDKASLKTWSPMLLF